MFYADSRYGCRKAGVYAGIRSDVRDWRRWCGCGRRWIVQNPNSKQNHRGNIKFTAGLEFITFRIYAAYSANTLLRKRIGYLLIRKINTSSVPSNCALSYPAEFCVSFCSPPRVQASRSRVRCFDRSTLTPSAFGSKRFAAPLSMPCTGTIAAHHKTAHTFRSNRSVDTCLRYRSDRSAIICCHIVIVQAKNAESTTISWLGVRLFQEFRSRIEVCIWFLLCSLSADSCWKGARE